MEVLITGAGGFIGQVLAAALLEDERISKISLTDVSTPRIPDKTPASSSCRVVTKAADLTDPAVCNEIITPNLTHIYLLHGIMSGAAEANLDLGLRVNVDSMRNVAAALASHASPDRTPPRVIFPSSLAVFGPAVERVKTTEETMPLPQSSYGTQKAMVEMLLSDFSRRGLLDVRIVRLPTIIIRPGAPSGAASSFCSGILREPLNGEKAVLPVDRQLKLWVSSTRTVIANLVLAKDIPAEKFGKRSRVVNLPGRTVTVEEMLSALRKVGGEESLRLVEEKKDESVERIVGSWPAEFDVEKARSLEFRDDVELVQMCRDYLADFAKSK